MKKLRVFLALLTLLLAMLFGPGFSASGAVLALFNAALDEYAKWYQRTNGAAASVPGAASQIAANTAARLK